MINTDSPWNSAMSYPTAAPSLTTYALPVLVCDVYTWTQPKTQSRQ